MMRRGYRYTAGDTPIRTGSDAAYKQAYNDRPWRVRIGWRFLAFVRRESLGAVVRDQLCKELEHEIADEAPGLIDRRAGTVGDRYISEVRQLAAAAGTIATTTNLMFHEHRHDFLCAVTKETWPDVDAAARRAMNVTIDVTTLQESPVASAREMVKQHIRGALSPLESSAASEIMPVWTALTVLQEISRFPFRSLMPEKPADAGARAVSLGVILPGLIRLQHLVYQINHSSIPAVVHIADRQRDVPGSSSLASTIDELVRITRRMRVADLIRIGLHDPKTEFSWTVPPANWFEETVAAYQHTAVETVHAQAHAQVRHHLEPYLHAPQPIPRGLPSLTLTAVLNVLTGTAFETAVRDLFEQVIDGEFEHPSTAVHLHQTVSELERSREALVHLLISSDERVGEILESLDRIERSAITASARSQKRRAYLSTVSARIETLVTVLGEAMTRVAELFANDGTEPPEYVAREWAAFGVLVVNAMRVERDV